MIRQEAEKAVLYGFCAAFFSAVLNIFAAISGVLSGGIGLGVASPRLFDGLIILILGFGVFKKSRMSGTLLIIYFLFSRIGSPAGIFINLIFLFFFWKGLRGTIAYHQIEKMDDPDYRPDSIWLVAIISSFVGLFVAFCLMMILVGTLSNTPAGVVSGYEIETEYRQELEAANLISASDELELVYSYGFSVPEGGNILTTDRLIHYAPKNGELHMNEIELDQIKEVVSKPNDELFGDTLYIVKTDTNEVELRFAFEEENLTFVETLKMNIP